MFPTKIGEADQATIPHWSHDTCHGTGHGRALRRHVVGLYFGTLCDHARADIKTLPSLPPRHGQKLNELTRRPREYDTGHNVVPKKLMSVEEGRENEGSAEQSTGNCCVWFSIDNITASIQPLGAGSV